MSWPACDATDADTIRSTGIEPVILDITKPEQVEALAARVADDPRPLHALVNNAGVQGRCRCPKTPCRSPDWAGRPHRSRP
ncbi:SDR family NAD(P)-dependent oxidoreductase [Streptomyces sp. NPDC001292]|uniref:SDR family NAD(P)-dependent oxidoreductase n=1 Tax=Streptomyces sp. NPDC001292 TaxID=3364558 RepID=UPI003696A800